MQFWTRSSIIQNANALGYLPEVIEELRARPFELVSKRTGKVFGIGIADYISRLHCGCIDIAMSEYDRVMVDLCDAHLNGPEPLNLDYVEIHIL